MMITRISASIQVTLILAVLLLLGGCGATPSRDPKFAPVRPPVPSAGPAHTNGAIYAATDGASPIYDVALFRDTRAHRVGDILTINLVENTSAEKENETVLEQDTEMSVTNPTIFGVSPSLKIPSVLNPVTGRILDHTLTPPANGRYDLSSAMASTKDFDGKGESSQSNRLTGEITVSVARVLANGNLMVQGEKIYSLNRGHEHLRFSGIVRPMDIDSDNTVESTRVANATIVYSGEGEVAGAGTLGWLGRVLLSTFFPL